MRNEETSIIIILWVLEGITIMSIIGWRVGRLWILWLCAKISNQPCILSWKNGREVYNIEEMRNEY